jgi:low molecular weight protein-tyrosine phosphatase
MASDTRYRVCFVCTGNICRSPMAEAVLRHLVTEAGLSDHVEVWSAGTGDWHVGDDADHRALSTLRGRGYDLRHRAQQWQAADFDRADLILALDRGHYRALRRLAPPGEQDKIRMLRSYDPDAGDDLDVPDPYYGDVAGFGHVLDLIETACEGVLAEIRTGLSPETSSGR